MARNTGIKTSNGKYICFLDADDIWVKDKLETQIDFMAKKKATFIFSGYQFADENGLPNGKVVSVPQRITYKEALKNTTIWTSTVMLNMNKITKTDILMPNIRRGQDTATWWKILKKIDSAYGINEVLAYYRRPSQSLSSNKLKALKRTWYLYRKNEHFGYIKSIYYFSFYIINAVRRRV